jgi:enoyl-CoA hydratase
MSTFEHIIVESKGAVGIITLNRPKILNALSFGVFGEIAAAVDDLEADDGIGCILLAGGEKAFAAGADIKEMQPKTFIEMFSSDFIGIGADRVARCRKPTIAAVSGYALGGGCELAMMCDIIIAADTAKFGQPEITLGTIPGIGGTQRPADKLMDEALAAAEKIASMSRPAAEMAKSAINRAFETPLTEGLNVERDLFHATFALEDRSEGMAAFIEKRKPVNRNR